MGLVTDPLEADLDRFASEHVVYKINMLLGQVQELVHDHHVNQRDPILTDALIEAAFVPLRVLDDFFAKGIGPHKADMLACYRLPSWRPEDVLAPVQLIDPIRIEN
jgi:hypothetical protein